jgi:hypothetical protein
MSETWPEDSRAFTVLDLPQDTIIEFFMRTRCAVGGCARNLPRVFRRKQFLARSLEDVARACCASRFLRAVLGTHFWLEWIRRLQLTSSAITAQHRSTYCALVCFAFLLVCLVLHTGTLSLRTCGNAVPLTDYPNDLPDLPQLRLLHSTAPQLPVRLHVMYLDAHFPFWKLPALEWKVHVDRPNSPCQLQVAKLSF